MEGEGGELGVTGGGVGSVLEKCLGKGSERFHFRVSS